MGSRTSRSPRKYLIARGTEPNVEFNANKPASLNTVNAAIGKTLQKNLYVPDEPTPKLIELMGVSLHLSEVTNQLRINNIYKSNK